jgi:integrase
MTFYNRNGILYVSISGKRISTKLKYSKENMKLYQSYSKNDEFFNKFAVMNKNKTFLDFCEEVLKDKEKTLKPISHYCYCSLFNKWIIPYFKDTLVQNIKPLHIKNFYDSFQDKSTLNTCVSAILKPAFEKAIIEEYIFSSPLQITKPRFRSVYEINPFTLKDIDFILSNIKNEQFKNFIGISFFTGMRTGELMALTWDNVDFINYKILIKLTHTNNFISTPKTKSSIRTIDMLSQSELYFRSQNEITKNSKYVFLRSDGKPYRASGSLQKYWIETLKELDFEHRSIYQTRHSFASNMLSNGESLMWVSKTLGHSNSSVTLQKYSRYLPTYTKERKRTFLDDM